MDKQKIVGICRDDLPQEKQCSGGGGVPQCPSFGSGRIFVFFRNLLELCE